MEAGLREKMHVDSLLKKKSFIHLCFLARDTVNEGDPEHRTWVSAARWVEATINQTMVSAVGGSLEMKLDRAERVWEVFYKSFGGSNRA